MTIVMDRPMPDGYTEDYDSTVWNAGFVYRWSEVYEAWLDCERVITVKPGQSVFDAFEDRMDCPLWDGYAVFFATSD